MDKKVKMFYKAIIFKYKMKKGIKKKRKMLRIIKS